jgi:formate dehydrogenase (NADP+) alpha subunit
MSIRIQIDNQPFIVEKGLTILQAARANNIEIPTLCDFPRLPSPGSCRMCVVEISGRANMPTACTTPAEEGMVIYTQSPKVRALRVELLQMLLSEHPSGCLFCPENTHCEECMVTLRKAAVTTGCSSCPKDEQCELQSLVEEYQVDKPGYPMRYRMIPVERHDPFFDRDYNLCILCGRCIRACEDLHFTGTLAFTKRGTHTLVGTSFYHSHLESSCTFCGACVEVCPTGALSEKTRKWDGRPERETVSTCPLCSIGCEIKLLSKKERVIGSLPLHANGQAGLCVKGRFGITELVNHPTRLKHPQKRIESTMLKIDWEETLRIAAEKLAACPPERFQMRISASCTSEDLYVAEKFTREVMKSTNIRTQVQPSQGAGVMEVSLAA